MVFGERLSEAERKSDFGIGQVDDNLSTGPLVWGERAFEASGSQNRGEVVNEAGSFRNHLKGVTISKTGLIWIQVHGETVTR